MGDLVFSQQLRQGCAPSHDRICSALQLRRGLQGREMVWLWFRFNPRVETFFGDLTIFPSAIL